MAMEAARGTMLYMHHSSIFSSSEPSSSSPPPIWSENACHALRHPVAFITSYDVQVYARTHSCTAAHCHTVGLTNRDVAVIDVLHRSRHCYSVSTALTYLQVFTFYFKWSWIVT